MAGETAPFTNYVGRVIGTDFMLATGDYTPHRLMLPMHGSSSFKDGQFVHEMLQLSGKDINDTFQNYPRVSEETQPRFYQYIWSRLQYKLHDLENRLQGPITSAQREAYKGEYDKVKEHMNTILPDFQRYKGEMPTLNQLLDGVDTIQGLVDATTAIGFFSPEIDVDNNESGKPLSGLDLLEIAVLNMGKNSIDDDPLLVEALKTSRNDGQPRIQFRKIAAKLDRVLNQDKNKKDENLRQLREWALAKRLNDLPNRTKPLADYEGKPNPNVTAVDAARYLIHWTNLGGLKDAVTLPYHKHVIQAIKQAAGRGENNEQVIAVCNVLAQWVGTIPQASAVLDMNYFSKLGAPLDQQVLTNMVAGYVNEYVPAPIRKELSQQAEYIGKDDGHQRLRDNLHLFSFGNVIIGASSVAGLGKKVNEDGAAVKATGTTSFRISAVDEMGGMGNGVRGSVRDIVAEAIMSDHDPIVTIPDKLNQKLIDDEGANATAAWCDIDQNGDGYRLEAVAKGDTRVIAFMPMSDGSLRSHAIGGDCIFSRYARENAYTISSDATTMYNRKGMGRYSPLSLRSSTLGLRQGGEEGVERLRLDCPKGTLVIVCSDGVGKNFTPDNIAKFWKESGNDMEKFYQLVSAALLRRMKSDLDTQRDQIMQEHLTKIAENGDVKITDPDMMFGDGNFAPDGAPYTTAADADNATMVAAFLR